jgi:hypothetical protein
LQQEEEEQAIAGAEQNLLPPELKVISEPLDCHQLATCMPDCVYLSVVEPGWN